MCHELSPELAAGWRFLRHYCPMSENKQKMKRQIVGHFGNVPQEIKSHAGAASSQVVQEA